ALPVLAGSRARIEWRLRRSHIYLRLAVEIELADQRQRQFRQLGLPCRCVDVGADAPEDGADLVPGFDVLEECGRIRTVAAGTVLCRAAGLCRIGDDHALGTVDLGQTTLQWQRAGRSQRALQLF